MYSYELFFMLKYFKIDLLHFVKTWCTLFCSVLGDLGINMVPTQSVKVLKVDS